jgi:cob(I)alamin adenosyltransferase
MSIYTKVGDDGSTRQIDGEMAPKNGPRCRALGALDELNAHLGLAVAQVRTQAGDKKASKARKERLAELEGSLVALCKHLLAAGSTVASAGTKHELPTTLNEEIIRQMETYIDRAWDAMPTLDHFILPVGGELSCRLHVCRTVCRRAERDVLDLRDSGVALPDMLLRYLNRLADLLFSLARLANFEDKIPDQVWTHDA